MPAATQVAAKSGAARAPGPNARASSKNATPVAKSAALASTAAAPLGPAITLKIAQPGKDPRFKATTDKLNKSAAKARSHPPAGKKAAEAQAAALPPANEKLAGANANKADKMAAAETAKPQPMSFLAMLRAEIQKVMPKKTKDAKGFMKGDDREQLKGAMTGNVQQQKGEATAGMQGASEAPPDTSAVQGKEVTPLPGEGVASSAAPVDAAEAMPAPKSAQEISLDQGKKDTDKLLTDAEVTTPQLQKANDPRFTAVVTTKGEADRYADTGPKQYSTKEQQMLSQAATQATGDEKKGLASFLAQGGKALKAVRGRQLNAKEKDELERKKVTDHIQGIFDRTKANVDKKLAGLDEEVSGLFDRGTDAAIAKMKGYVETRFDDRYSGLTGKARWLKDKLLPLPDSVKTWFGEAHKVFLQELDALVVRVADLVERRLKEAKDEIARGQKEISVFVQGLKGDLQLVGKTAEKEMQGRFDELRQGVDDKKNDLAQKLAQRYKDASEKGEKALQELKDAHKSLYERVRDAIAEIIKVLRDFKNRVLAMFKKAKNAVDLIVSDPIGFLKNVLAAIKLGLSQFVDNIWTHLKAGFIAWMFGSLGNAGVEVPKDFSLGSLLKLVLQVLGLTYDRLRVKAVKLLGERAVSVIEQVAKFIWTLVTEGPAKLWEMIKEYLSNLKEMIIDAIQDWVITTIIKAAVTKLVSMFNPVGAIIQAILTIYNVVMFLIERINQILAFVESVINSVYEIATGQIGAAANWIEKALARTIPIIIAFLARLLGITGITEKIVGVIKKIQSKVDQALDKVIAKIAAGIGKLVGGVKAGVAAVLVWWKKRVRFKTGDGQEHSISIESDSPSVDPVVQSKPTYLGELVGRIKDATIKKKAQAKQRQIAELIKLGRLDKTPEAVNQRSQDLEKKLQEMGAILVEGKVLDATVLPTPTFEYKPLGNKAKKAIVKNLSAVRQWGSVPGSANPVGWRYVQDIGRTGAGPYFRRLHLINHRFGGPGMNSNLAVAGKTDNEKHLKVENKIKEIVGDTPNEKDKPGVITKYEVTVNYRAAKSLGGGAANLGEFPKSFTCVWSYVDAWPKSSSTPEKKQTETIDFEDWTSTL